MVFDESTEIIKLMKAIHDPFERLKWDRDVEISVKVSLPKPNVLIWH
jgi:hypothetical protein